MSSFKSVTTSFTVKPCTSCPWDQMWCKALTLLHSSHRCVLLFPRKFQKNASTQYALEQLTDEEKEGILQSGSLERFMKLVTPRYNSPSFTLWLHAINRTSWAAAPACFLGRCSTCSRRPSWTCSKTTAKIWRKWPKSAGLKRLPKI